MQQIFGGLRFGQIGVADVQHGRGSIGLFVDLVDDAVANRHGGFSGYSKKVGSLEKE